MKSTQTTESFPSWRRSAAWAAALVGVFCPAVHARQATYLVAGVSSSDFSIARLAANGSLDTTFESGGTVRFNISGTDAARGMARQPDGKIVLVGESSDDFAVARLTANGSLDTSFGNGGTVRFNISGTDRATAVAIRPDGKIVVGGESSGDFAAARLNANGSLDSSFGNGGTVRFNISGTDVANDLKLQPDGKIVLAGESSGDFAAARLGSNGTLDSSFGNGGTVRFNISGSDSAAGIAILVDGKMVLCGESSGDFAAARLTVNGTVDSSFGNGGTRRFNISGTDTAHDLVVLPDGKIVLAGESSGDFAAARLSAGGDLDTTFGSGGSVRHNLSGTDRAFAITRQSDGKLLLAGGSSGDYAVARISASGSLDTGFGSGGSVRFSILGTDIAYAVLAIESSGPPGGWTPAELSGLQAWFKADAIPASDRVSNLVSRWVDVAGGFDVTASGFSRPAYIQNGQAGKPVVRFDGNNDGLTRGSSNLLRNANGGTMFAVRRYASVPTTVRAVAFLSAGSASNLARLALQSTSTGQPRAAARRLDSQSTVIVSSASSVSTGFQLHGAVADFVSGNLTQWINGNTAGSASMTTGQTSNTNSLGLALGRNVSADSYLSGDLAEVILVSGTIGTCDRRKIEGYLAHRWGIASSLPSSHPFRNSPPASGQSCLSSLDGEGEGSAPEPDCLELLQAAIDAGATLDANEFPCLVCLADLDGDGEIGTGDLSILLSAWGTPGGPADLDRDGEVGQDDLPILLGSWQALCNE